MFYKPIFCCHLLAHDNSPNTDLFELAGFIIMQEKFWIVCIKFIKTFHLVEDGTGQVTVEAKEVELRHIKNITGPFILRGRVSNGRADLCMHDLSKIYVDLLVPIPDEILQERILSVLLTD